MFQLAAASFSESTSGPGLPFLDFHVQSGALDYLTISSGMVKQPLLSNQHDLCRKIHIISGIFILQQLSRILPKLVCTY